MSIQRTFNHVKKLRMTFSAKQSQRLLGFQDQDVIDAIQLLTPYNFYKSMPPIHPKFTAMQDVYKSVYKEKPLYMKFQKSTFGKIILSFKEAT